ncbi:Integrase H2C2 domain-containing protein [Aphis craccivora]|uniref:Integrase H2C2 domain-containing protein n=1 Tax=Aphis craccivora TaxID=307492 RepID=A0A6G0VQ76_APHCR|nr:Integrase H2C2 domain-containing protein [Aphis craccivora]
MSNSLDKYKPVKLEGKPIVLITTNKLKMLQNREVKKVMQSIGRIFRNKPK